MAHEGPIVMAGLVPAIHGFLVPCIRVGTSFETRSSRTAPQDEDVGFPASATDLQRTNLLILRRPRERPSRRRADTNAAGAYPYLPADNPPSATIVWPWM
jgi:hypothetical protein